MMMIMIIIIIIIMIIIGSLMSVSFSKEDTRDEYCGTRYRYIYHLRCSIVSFVVIYYI